MQRDRTCWRSGNADLSQLLQNAVKWVQGDDPVVSISGDGIIEAFAHGAIRHTYALGPQQVRFRVSRGGSIKSVRSLRSSANLSFQQQSDIVSFEVPGIADYEVISLVANR
ncbi:MAG: hypothetical protein DMG46_01900 [Acidobacteria bacterium]|nr:MAG: hypothetical protein DMG46_01900 [Acidobacteriota bacterium]